MWLQYSTMDGDVQDISEDSESNQVAELSVKSKAGNKKGPEGPLLDTKVSLIRTNRANRRCPMGPKHRSYNAHGLYIARCQCQNLRPLNSAMEYGQSASGR